MCGDIPQEDPMNDVDRAREGDCRAHSRRSGRRGVALAIGRRTAASTPDGYVVKPPSRSTSILAPIEHRWGLAPLTARDAAANDMHNAFDFSQGVGEGRGR
jgi:hypothetical protein